MGVAVHTGRLSFGYTRISADKVEPAEEVRQAYYHSPPDHNSYDFNEAIDAYFLFDTIEQRLLPQVNSGSALLEVLNKIHLSLGEANLKSVTVVETLMDNLDVDFLVSHLPDNLNGLLENTGHYFGTTEYLPEQIATFLIGVRDIVLELREGVGVGEIQPDELERALYLIQDVAQLYVDNSAEVVLYEKYSERAVNRALSLFGAFIPEYSSFSSRFDKMILAVMAVAILCGGGGAIFADLMDNQPNNEFSFKPPPPDTPDLQFFSVISCLPDYGDECSAYDPGVHYQDMQPTATPIPNLMGQLISTDEKSAVDVMRAHQQQIYDTYFRFLPADSTVGIQISDAIGQSLYQNQSDMKVVIYPESESGTASVINAFPIVKNALEKYFSEYVDPSGAAYSTIYPTERTMEKIYAFLDTQDIGSLPGVRESLAERILTTHQYELLKMLHHPAFQTEYPFGVMYEISFERALNYAGPQIELEQARWRKYEFAGYACGGAVLLAVIAIVARFIQKRRSN